MSGDSQGAITLLQPMAPQGGVGAQRDAFLAIAYGAQGQFALAAAAILSITPDQVIFPKESVVEAAARIRKAPGPIAAPSPSSASESSQLAFVFAYTGAPERLFDAPERAVATGNQLNGVNGWTLWSPLFAEVRRTERFNTLMRKMGLVDYWRARGWPDLCHPTTGDDFACE
jgi:hypothetical protein